jgi:hypothetical protein
VKRELIQTTRSFTLGFWSSLLLGLLGGLVLSLLGILFLLVHSLFVSLSLSDLGFLPLLDLSDCFLSQSLFVLSLGVLKLIDGFKSNTLDGSLFFLFIVSLSLDLSGFCLFDLLVESSPGGGPSESLSFQLSA